MSVDPTSTEQRARFILQPRDILLILFIFYATIVTRNQILLAGFWGSVVRCNTRLRTLVAARYLVRLRSEFDRQSLYGLGPAAAALIATELGIDIETVKRQARIGQSVQFLTHTLRIVDVHLAFATAAKQTGIAFLWRSERQVRHEYKTREGTRWQTHILKPDGMARFGDAGSYRHCYVECDLSHRSSAAMGALFSSYCHYRANVFTEIYGASSFVVLCIVPGARRLSHLQAVAQSVGADFVRFTTYDQLFSVGPLGPIWLTPAGTVPVSLLP